MTARNATPLCCAFRSPASASRRLPGTAAKSYRRRAASSIVNFRLSQATEVTIDFRSMTLILR
jgi:hypothetical protein